jgi:hypothetical protein
MTTSSYPTAEPARDPDFPAKRHSVPLAVASPNIIGFSVCPIAPGLEIREATQADTDRLGDLNKTWASTLTMMQIVPLAHSSHVLCIDEQVYGHHAEQQIRRATGKETDPTFKRFHIDDVQKMIVTALHLFRLVPLFNTRYFITEEYDRNFLYFGFLRPPIQVTYDSWHRYAVPITGYNLTNNGAITCDDVIRAVNVLEKYYRHNYWLGNRIAVALHNFWNALFIGDSALAFVALVTVIETFTNLNKKENTGEQVYRNTLKLVPVDGHGNAVTRDRLEEMYSVRSTLLHGSYGRDSNRGDSTVQGGWGVTHLDAKFSNVDVRLSTGVMSITAKLLHTVLFDPTILSLLEGAETSAQERRRLREHLDAMPGAAP